MRAVNVLRVVSKIFERIIHKKINAHRKTIYLSFYLCAFRKVFNTQHALNFLLEKWKNSLYSKGYAVVILMDISKI